MTEIEKELCENKNEFIINDNYAEMIIVSPKYGTKKALIDVEDIEKVDKYKWHLSGLKKKGNHYVKHTQIKDYIDIF